MKYMLLLADDPELAAADDVQAVMQEYFDFTNRIAASGELVAGDALHDVSTASTLRIRNGSTTVTDGPFAETKEAIGGFYVVEVPSLDRALELAAMIPAARTGGVEVRPVMEFS